MSTDAYYHPRNMKIDLAILPLSLYNEIASLRGHLKRNDDPPVLTCLRTNDLPMYVYRAVSGRYFIRHYPGEGATCHHTFATISDEHRRQAEYTARAATEYGLQADLEVSTGGGTRVDVGVFGDITTGFEIQRSAITRVRAKDRAAKSFGAGWPTVWVHGNAREPDWVDHVPTAWLTVRAASWETLPPRGSANVIIRRFRRERDKDFRHGWRYMHEPTAVTLDELAYLVPMGEIIPVAVGTKGRVVLAHKGAAEIIDSCTYPGASLWHPNSKTPQRKVSVQTISRPCHNSHNDIPPIVPLYPSLSFIASQTELIVPILCVWCNEQPRTIGMTCNACTKLLREHKWQDQ